MHRRNGLVWLGIVVFAILGFTVGMVMGSRGGRSGSVAGSPVTVTVTKPAERPAPARLPDGDAPRRQRPSRASAVAAAIAYLEQLGGRTLLDPARVRATVEAITAPAARKDLARAYELASLQARQQLGLGIAPEPVVILRAVPVGFRVDEYAPGSATVSVWRVGIVGSGATADPRQSWRTETVSLVWDGGWKIASLGSTPGPTPPLAGAPSAPGDLFASIPRFEEVGDAHP